MSDLIAFILDIYLDIQHWIKHKKQRKFEKENNLPKSIVWHPMTKPLFILFIIIVPVSTLLFFSTTINKNDEKTEEKLQEIVKLLAAEKKQFGKYPSELKTIIRNNPLRKNLEKDSWKNEFIYTLSKDSLNYSIVSLGGDQKLNTSDDIKITN